MGIYLLVTRDVTHITGSSYGSVYWHTKNQNSLWPPQEADLTFWVRERKVPLLEKSKWPDLVLLDGSGKRGLNFNGVTSEMCSPGLNLPRLVVRNRAHTLGSACLWSQHTECQKRKVQMLREGAANSRLSVPVTSALWRWRWVVFRIREEEEVGSWEDAESVKAQFPPQVEKKAWGKAANKLLSEEGSIARLLGKGKCHLGHSRFHLMV